MPNSLLDRITIPAIGLRLWLTLAALLGSSLNLALLREIWLHTPAAAPVLAALVWLLVLALIPQLLVWGRSWMWGYVGPAWLRLLLGICYVGAAFVGIGIWVLLLLGGVAVGLHSLYSL
jgi:hypothetical protein